MATQRILFARAPNWSVESVSSLFDWSMARHMIMLVFEFPPRLSRRRCVSLPIGGEKKRNTSCVKTAVTNQVKSKQKNYGDVRLSRTSNTHSTHSTHSMHSTHSTYHTPRRRRRRVSLLSRYGTWVAFLPRPEDDVSALIQLPNAERDWLILWASFNVCVSTGVYGVYIGCLEVY